MAEVLWRVVTLMESDCPAVDVPPAMDTVCVSAPVPEENAASLSHAAGREGLISSPPVYLMFSAVPPTVPSSVMMPPASMPTVSEPQVCRFRIRDNLVWPRDRVIPALQAGVAVAHGFQFHAHLTVELARCRSIRGIKDNRRCRHGVGNISA